MAWQEQLTIIVRTLINDLGPTYTYDDSRIEQCLVVAAKYVQFDVVLDHSYAVDVVNLSISPDPTLDNDDIFISLVSLKAACIIDQSNFRTKAALEGIRAALGPASLSVGGNITGWKHIIEHGPCALYDDLVEHWDVANASAVRAIFSPFIGNNFDPQNLNNPDYNHSRFKNNQFY
jgi:hypothetical protein